MCYQLRRIGGRLVGALALAVLAGAASAEVDERIQQMLDEMAKAISEPTPVFLRQRVEVAVNGKVQEEHLQELWMRDLQHLRMERSDGTVIVMAPENIHMFVGPPRVMVHIPQETLEAFGDKRAEALKALDISQPGDMLQAIIDGAEHLQITGEDTIAEEPCWVVTVGEPLFPQFREAVAGIPPQFTLKTVLLAIGRETDVSRQTFFEFTGPAQLEISVTIEEVSEEVETPDELFVYEAPEDALVLTWTLDKTPEQVRKELADAIAARVK